MTDTEQQIPPAAPVNPKTPDGALRHTVTKYVFALLRSGELGPGERVRETALADALGVSFSPIREALFRLADQGVLEHRPRRGFVVSSLGDRQIREIFTFRSLLEGFAARVIAERRLGNEEFGDPLDPAAFDELGALIDEGEQASLAGDVLGVRACNEKLHDAIVRLADHTLLSRAWALLAPAIWLGTPGVMLLPPAPAPTGDWSARHRRLVATLKTGTPEAAEYEAASHVITAGRGRLRRTQAAATREVAAPQQLAHPRLVKSSSDDV